MEIEVKCGCKQKKPPEENGFSHVKHVLFSYIQNYSWMPEEMRHKL